MNPEELEIESQSNEEEMPMGLSAGIEKYLSGEVTLDNNEPAPTETQKTPTKESSQDTNDKDEDSEEEEEFPDIGTAEKALNKEESEEEEEFNEEEFEKQTEEEVKGMSDKAAARFKKLKSELKELKKKTAATKPAEGEIPQEVKQELETLRLAAKEAEDLKERNKQLLAANDKVAVRESDTYIKEVSEPLDAIDKVITQISEYSGIEIKALANAIAEEDINKQDEMLEELEGKVGRRIASRIERLADDFKMIRAKERDLVANAATTIEQGRLIKQKEEAKKIEETKSKFRLAAEESFNSYASRVPGMTDSSGNLTDSAKALVDKVKTIDPTTLSPVDIGFMAFCAKAFPEARRAIVALEKENALLKASSGSTGSTVKTGNAPKKSSSDKEGAGLGLAAHMATQDLIFTGR